MKSRLKKTNLQYISCVVLILSLLTGVGCQSVSAKPANGLEATYLRCEYKSSPDGIDAVKPRLSWIVESDQRGQCQTAYRVLVATSPEKLVKENGDLWDSDKVISDETTRIDYAGKALKSYMPCYWKVMVWDKDGKPSDWSEPAKWSMGVLDAWQGKWIGFDTKKTDAFKAQHSSQESCPLTVADRWVWDADGNDKKGTWYFRKAFDVPADVKINGKLMITVDDESVIYLNGVKKAQTNSWKKIYTFDLSDSIRVGQNVLAIEATNTSDSPAAIIGRLDLTFNNGTKKQLRLDALVSSKKADDGWKKVDYNDRDWKRVKVLHKFGDGPWGNLESDVLMLPPASYLRKGFTAKKDIKRAMLYASALGICKLQVNGRVVGDDYFSPGWTDYNKRVYYHAYDVTDALAKGRNALGAIVADGWYAGYIGFGKRRHHYSDRTWFSAQLHVEYADGTSELVVTDKSWKASTGPTLEADFLMGETYDARLEMPGWSATGFDASGWQSVDVNDSVKAKIQPHPGDPVTVFQEIKPVKMHESSRGVYVYDFGTNFAGWVRLKIKGRKGEKIVLRFAERLNPDGSVYTTNLRAARVIDTYICKGDGIEIWEPNFTFHGFQYAEITGCSHKPTLETLTGIEVTSATPVAGSFRCNDKQSNQLYHNICQTQRSNFIDIPTDCPQRDERLGWTGDAQVYIRTACLNNDTQAFFTKWLVDLNDAQRSDGQFPKVAPQKVAGDDGGPAWADAGTICPWAIYEVYGDKQILEKSYPAMKKFIAFSKNRCREGLLPPTKYHCYGDWLDINDPTSKDVIYMVYFANSTDLTAKTAHILGKEQEAAEYEKLAAQIRASFNKNFVDKDGKIESDSQTSYVMAIAYDMVEDERMKQAADHLIRKVKERNWHLSTGFVGTKDLMLALAKIDRNDIAYRLFHNDAFPSWGFPIKHGATSIWERWNGWTPDKGFGNPGMNSFAHYSFGAVGQWMFENIAGIRSEGPAYKQITINPQLGGKITTAQTTYNSIRGPITSDWILSGNKFELKVVIPANTQATIHVPAADEKKVLEGKIPASKAAGVTFVRFESDRAVYKVTSGNYTFTSTVR